MIRGTCHPAGVIILTFLFMQIYFFIIRLTVSPPLLIITGVVMENTAVKKTVYLILAIFGFILPYYFVFKFYTANEMTTLAALAQLTALDWGALIAADLTVSIFTAWAFYYNEAKRLAMKNWWLYLAATLMVGLSFSLPLFLYFRERRLER